MSAKRKKTTKRPSKTEQQRDMAMARLVTLHRSLREVLSKKHNNCACELCLLAFQPWSAPLGNS